MMRFIMISNIEKVRHISKRMATFCNLLMVSIPLVLIWSWIDFEGARALGFYERVAYPIDAPATLSLAMGFLVSAFLTVFIIGAIYHLREFFKFGIKGNMFSEQGGDAFHKSAKYLVIYAFLSIPAETLIGVILTINNPVGERLLKLSFNTYDLSLIFLSLVIFSVSWVLKESVLIAQDNAQIV